jgi:hypothetical protein
LRPALANLNAKLPAEAISTAGSKHIQELFNELLALSRALTEEQTRHVREI